MLVWLITIGEPVPTDGGTDRLLRTGILADLLAQKGHEVLWWTSTFDHVRKQQRFLANTTVTISEKYQLRFLYGITYRKNISIRRIINHIGLALQFRRWAESETVPDIILCSLPSLELSRAATKYGKQKGVPVVLDARDMWPDIFVNLVPGWCKGLARVMLGSMFKLAKDSFQNATAIIGITPDFVKWGLEYSGRERTQWDRDFPLGYVSKTPDNAAVQAAELFWTQHGIVKNSSDFIICFMGTIGRQFELETIIEAARQLQRLKAPVRFVLCGSGDNLTYYQKMAADCANIFFPGWIGAAQIWTLLRIAAAGIAPYHSTPDFCASIPNKAVEYLSAGLPVISSLKGTLKELLENYDCGVTYENNQADDLIAKILFLEQNGANRNLKSQNAIKLYQEKFVAEKVYQELNQYLETMAIHYRNQ